MGILDCFNVWERTNDITAHKDILMRDNGIKIGLFWEPVEDATDYKIIIYRVNRHSYLSKDLLYGTTFDLISNPADSYRIVDLGDGKYKYSDEVYVDNPLFLNGNIVICRRTYSGTFCDLDEESCIPLLTSAPNFGENCYTFDYFPGMVYIVLLSCKVNGAEAFYPPYLYSTRKKK